MSDPRSAKQPDRDSNESVVAEWWAKATEDFEVAEQLIGERPPKRLNTVGFLSQQAVENLIKAAIIRHHALAPRTHDLKYLSEILSTVAPGWSWPEHELTDLTSFAVEYRYPGFDADIEEASRAFATARALWNALLPLIR